jgi:hypothetical protein
MKEQKDEKETFSATDCCIINVNAELSSSDCD